MKTVLVEVDRVTVDTLQAAIGPECVVVPTIEGLSRHLEEDSAVGVVVLGPSVEPQGAYKLAERMRLQRPALGLILVRFRVETAVLTDALRAGVREVVSERDLGTLSSAVRRLEEVARRARERAGAPEPSDEHRAQVVTVFAAKGGCGKTTLATNLAPALANRGRRDVCLVDLDLAFGDVAIALQMQPAHTIADAVPKAGSLDDHGVAGLLTRHSPGFSTLAAPLEPSAADTISASLVAELLTILRRMFDVVIIDTPAGFTDHVLAAFDMTDVFLLLATLDVPALKNLKLTLETLDLLNYPREHWRVVLNRADSKVGLHVPDVERTLRTKISVQIPSSRAVPASINRGVPLVLEEPSHPVSAVIKQLAERLAATAPTKRQGDAGRRGLPWRRAKNT